ncbi:hypothetical protein B0J11DRAFT_396378, partial [Dendryphion nanum]
DFLFWRQVSDITNSRCECGERRQIVAHILLRCRKYRDLRNRASEGLLGRQNLRAIM